MSSMDASQILALFHQFLKTQGVALDSFKIDLTPCAPKACVPPPAVAAFLATQAAAPQSDSPASPDSDMEHSDATSVTSSSRKRTALSSTGSSDSSDSEGTITDSQAEFTLVKSKRGPKRAATSRTPPASAAAAARTPSAAASTSAAPIVAPTSAAPNAAASQSKDNTAKPATRCAPELAKKQVPPPVFLRDKAKFTQLSKTLYAKRIKYDQATNVGEAIKIIPASIEDFRNITRLFTAERVSYHTYALAEERKVKAVLRGVPYELANEDILEDLKSQGFPIESVHKMHSSRGERFNLALLVLTNVPEAKAIFREVRTVCGLSRVKVEAPHRRGYPAQCHRCQLYGHAAANCSAPPRCIKCLEPHHSKECPRPKNAESPPSCVLCGQTGHPANFRGCPRAPRPPPSRKAPPQVNDRTFPALVSRKPSQGQPLPQPPQGSSQPTQGIYRAPQGPYRPPQGPPRPLMSLPLSQPAPLPINPWFQKESNIPRPSADPKKQTDSVVESLNLVYNTLNRINLDEILILAGKLRTAQSPQDRLLALTEHINLLRSL